MGRPTKLNPKTHKAIVDAIGLGVTLEAAAGAAGVSYNTFNEWMLKGAAAKSGLYREFYEAVERERAAAISKFTQTLTGAAAKGDWKAALEWLKRRDRLNWGDSLKLDVGSLTDDDIKRIFAVAAITASRDGGAEAGHTDTADAPAASDAA